MTGIVLSGGGARGAYEVGVIKGIVEVLGLKPESSSPFDVFTGTSVGAINAAYLAAHGHRGDLNVAGLTEMWQDLNLVTHFRVDPLGFLSFGHWYRRLRGQSREIKGRALLDLEALENTIRGSGIWSQLNDNIDSGTVKALVVAALRISSGRTALFCQTAPTVNFRPSRDPRRYAVETTITAEHVLASAAIPLIFPVRFLGDGWYGDGSLRFNTPISPAIRCGAKRLLVISLLHENQQYEEPPGDPDMYPGPAVLLGKLLNALLLDPIDYDLSVLERFNRLLAVLDESLGPKTRQRVDQVSTEMRGAAYEPIETLVFSPSGDLGEIAGHHLRERGHIPELGRMGSWFMRRAAMEDATWELDLASYVLFDGLYLSKLIEMGYRDALARRSEIINFF